MTVTKHLAHSLPGRTPETFLLGQAAGLTHYGPYLQVAAVSHTAHRTPVSYQKANLKVTYMWVVLSPGCLD